MTKKVPERHSSISSIHSINTNTSIPSTSSSTQPPTGPLHAPGMTEQHVDLVRNTLRANLNQEQYESVVKTWQQRKDETIQGIRAQGSMDMNLVMDPFYMANELGFLDAKGVDVCQGLVGNRTGWYKKAGIGFEMSEESSGPSQMAFSGVRRSLTAPGIVPRPAGPSSFAGPAHSGFILPSNSAFTLPFNNGFTLPSNSAFAGPSTSAFTGSSPTVFAGPSRSALERPYSLASPSFFTSPSSAVAVATLASSTDSSSAFTGPSPLPVPSPASSFGLPPIGFYSTAAPPQTNKCKGKEKAVDNPTKKSQDKGKGKATELIDLITPTASPQTSPSTSIDPWMPIFECMSLEQLNDFHDNGADPLDFDTCMGGMYMSPEVEEQMVSDFLKLCGYVGDGEIPWEEWTDYEGWC